MRGGSTFRFELNNNKDKFKYIGVLDMQTHKYNISNIEGIDPTQEYKLTGKFPIEGL